MSCFLVLCAFLHQTLDVRFDAEEEERQLAEQFSGRVEESMRHVVSNAKHFVMQFLQVSAFAFLLAFDSAHDSQTVIVQHIYYGLVSIWR